KRLNLLPARCAQYGRFFYAAYVAPAPHLHLKFEPRLTDSLIQAHGRPRPNLVGYSFCFLWAGAIGSGWQVRPYFSAMDGPLQGKYTEGFYWGSASLLCEHSSCERMLDCFSTLPPDYVSEWSSAEHDAKVARTHSNRFGPDAA